ncbi:MAG: hypothetical protein FJ029_01700 [Actinobacteria bacterium]|nr:hypothetical protein [Actinomycetota bacterium]
MAGDVFYKEIKPVVAPRGAIVPPGCVVEKAGTAAILRVPAGITHIATPLIFAAFTLVIEGPELTVDGPAIVDAAINVRNLDAPNTILRLPRQIEVIDLLRVRDVRALMVRAGRIEARTVEAERSVRARADLIARTVRVHHGALRAARLIAEASQGENRAGATIPWAVALTQGLVPDWLRTAG